MKSPLAATRKLTNVLGYLFIVPMYFEDDESFQAKLSVFSSLKASVYGIMLLGSFVLLWFKGVNDGISPGEAVSVILKIFPNPMDLVMMPTLLLINFVVSGSVTLLLYLRQENVRAMLEMTRLLPIEANEQRFWKDSGRKTYRRFFLYIFISFCTGCSLAALWTLSMMEANYTMDVLMVLLIVIWIVGAMVLLNPLMATYFDLVSWTAVEYIAEAFQAWTDDINSEELQETSTRSTTAKSRNSIVPESALSYRAPADRKITSIEEELNGVQIPKRTWAQEMKSRLTVMVRLKHLVEKTDSTIGPVLLVSFVTSVLNAIIASFSSTSILFHLFELRIEFVLNTVAFLGTAFIYWSRMYTLVCAGQDVMTQMQNAKDALEDHIMSVGFSRLDRADQIRVNAIREWLGTTCPFQPEEYFRLEKSTILSLFTTVLTYVIILMQFKQSSPAAEDPAANNSTVAAAFNNTTSSTNCTVPTN